MPQVKNQVFRIKVIDELLSRTRFVKTTKIIEVIYSKLLISVSERTIQKDIQDMRENTYLGYYAPIEYDKRRMAYYYSEEGYTINNFSLNPKEIDSLKFYAECLQAFSGYKLFNSFTSGIEKVINGIQAKARLKPSSNHKLIIQTDTVVTAEGDEFITDMVYAIDNRLICEIEYLPYGTDQPYRRRILPLLLKEYKNRWYLLSFRLDKNEIRTYALDRVKLFEMTEEMSSVSPPFDAVQYFTHSFGITKPDAKVETVILRFTIDQAPYLKSLPIHSTQTILSETKRTITISILVILSYEVYEFILGKSPNVKVLRPLSLASEIADKLEKTTALYKRSKRVSSRT